jgi:phage terminase large subunit-like protein
MTDDIHHMLAQLDDYELRILKWHLLRREAQTPPDPLPYIWFLKGGRNSGKTITASNHVFEMACTLPFIPENRVVRVALVGETFNDVKDTMVEGKTGLLSVVPEEMVRAWNRSLGELRVELPRSSSVPERREIWFKGYTAERPDKLRGPAFQLAWIDEPAKLRDADEDPEKAGTTFSNLTMTLRTGRPHLIVTGTPTPCRLIRYLIDHEDSVVTHMRSRDNAANVDELVRQGWARLAPTSRTARQELDAEVLEDNPEAVFFQAVIDETRSDPPLEDPGFARVLGWDPSVTSGEDSDEAGIVLTGWTPERREKGVQSGKSFTPAEAYVLADLSRRYTPTEQTRLVIRTMLEQEVEDLVFESNQGADFIRTQVNTELTQQSLEPPTWRELRSKAIKYGSLKRWRYRGVREDGQPYTFVLNAIHAQKGKQPRAEVAAMKYDSGQVHHPPAGLETLEKEMTGWSPLAKKSPNRVDAVTYTLLHIFGAKEMIRHGPARLSAPSTAPAPLAPTDAARRRASIWSMDLMDRRGPR